MMVQKPWCANGDWTDSSFTEAKKVIASGPTGYCLGAIGMPQQKYTIFSWGALYQGENAQVLSLPFQKRSIHARDRLVYKSHTPMPTHTEQKTAVILSKGKEKVGLIYHHILIFNLKNQLKVAYNLLGSFLGVFSFLLKQLNSKGFLQSQQPKPLQNPPHRTHQFLAQAQPELTAHVHLNLPPLG